MPDSSDADLNELLTIVVADIRAEKLVVQQCYRAQDFDGMREANGRILSLERQRSALKNRIDRADAG